MMSIFPPLFLYATQGFTKLTIVAMAYCGSLLAAAIIMQLIYLYTNPQIEAIAAVIWYILKCLIFPPLFVAATEGFNYMTITFLILFEVPIFVSVRLLFPINSEQVVGICMGVALLFHYAMHIYVIVISFSLKIY